MTPQQSHSGLLLAGRYQLGDVMAIGAMSTIYRGQDTVLQRPLVVKAVPPHHADAFRQALQRTSGLTHPAIVATYDALEYQDWLFVAQESVSARSLDMYLGSGIPSERSLDLALQLARALAYAHSHSVVHGDLTPVAVLVDRRAQVHLNNFALPPDAAYFIGVANSLPTDSDGDGLHSLYSAPPTPEADVRAVGLLLWQMLRIPTKEQPGAGERPERGEFRADVPDPVRELVWRCLRPQDPRPIRDAESLTLALELEAHALASTRAPYSELTPPALRAAREALAEKASWSTADTLGVAQAWPNPVLAGSGRIGQPNQTPGTSTTEWQEPRSRIATEEPPGQPKLRLPSRSDAGAAVAYSQSDAPEWLEHDVTQPETKSVDHVSPRGETTPRRTTVGIPVLLVSGAALFLVAFVIGFFLLAAQGGR